MSFEVAELLLDRSLPGGWEVRKVGEFSEVNARSISRKNPPNEIKYLDISSVATRLHDKPKIMAFADAPSRAQRVVSSGDTLIATVRPNLRSFVYIKDAEKNLIASTGFACVSSKVKEDSRYLHYYLTSDALVEYFVRLADGAAYPAFDYKLIAQSEIIWPPEPERHEIGLILGALDDRIILLRETNATLEAIAQAMFKAWFVDFDPVHAKQQGRAPEGMDEATAALFPDGFEESELGLVPKGWKVTNVGEVAEVIKGKSYSSKDLAVTSDTALVSLKSFERGGGFRLDGFKPYSGSYKPSQVVVPGDLIIAYTDVTQAAELIGKPAIVVGVTEFKTLVASLDVGIIRPIVGKSNRQFLYGLFRTEGFQSHTFAHTSGTTVLHLAKEGVGSFQFSCPPIELTTAFEEIAEAIAGRAQLNIDQMRNLATLRDTLLPRLISGQLRLPEAQAVIEETIV